MTHLVGNHIDLRRVHGNKGRIDSHRLKREMQARVAFFDFLEDFDIVARELAIIIRIRIRLDRAARCHDDVLGILIAAGAVVALITAAAGQYAEPCNHHGCQ